MGKSTPKPPKPAELPKPPPPPPPAPEAPPKAPTVGDEKTADNAALASKKRGTSSLRIDLNTGAQRPGTGLNIPGR